MAGPDPAPFVVVTPPLTGPLDDCVVGVPPPCRLTGVVDSVGPVAIVDVVVDPVVVDSVGPVAIVVVVLDAVVVVSSLVGVVASVVVVLQPQ